jgi:hypothetical protein
LQHCSSSLTPLHDAAATNNNRLLTPLPLLTTVADATTALLKPPPPPPLKQAACIDHQPMLLEHRCRNTLRQSVPATTDHQQGQRHWHYEYHGEQILIVYNN